MVPINCCRQCPYAKSAAALHDDPFTSAPMSDSRYCVKLNEKRISNLGTVDRDCPLPEVPA